MPRTKSLPSGRMLAVGAGLLAASLSLSPLHAEPQHTCGDGHNSAITDRGAQLISWECIPSAIQYFRDGNGDISGSDEFVIEVDAGMAAYAVTLDRRFYGNRYSPTIPLDGFGMPTVDVLLDNGVAPDRIANDNIFTAGPFELNPLQTVPGTFNGHPDGAPYVTADSIGMVQIQETALSSPYTMLQQVRLGLLDGTIMPIAGTCHRGDIQILPYIINIQTPDRTIGKYLTNQAVFPTEYPNLVSRAFDATLDVDFIIYTTSTFLQTSQSTTYSTGIHNGVKNNVYGINQNQFDNTANYGSDGKLQSTIAINIHQWSSFLFAHELSHRWSAHLYSNEIPPTNNYSVAGHWMRISTPSPVGNGGGGYWIETSPGNYEYDCTNGGIQHTAGDLDLYLMGAIGPATPGLGPWHLANTSLIPTATVGCATSATWTSGAIVQTKTISDIEADYGMRTPAATGTPQSFTIAFVIESHKRMLTPVEMTFYNIMAEYIFTPIPPLDPTPALSTTWHSLSRFWDPYAEFSTLIPARCKADYNRDGSVTFDDLLFMLDLHSANDPAADYDCSGVLDNDDIYALLADTSIPCP